MKMFVLLTFLTACLALGPVSSDKPSIQSGDGSSPGHEAFPITVDFHCPRNFGFHIGDEIPLTVTLETRDGHMIDLVNLPREEETHGIFEVRKVRVRERRKNGGTTYTILYLLQSFEPAIAVDKLKFPPLRISYATEEDWNRVASKYRYRHLFSQPFDIFVSRTATYYGPMKDIKGPIMDERAAVIWKAAIIVGGIVVFVAFLTWPWELIRRRGRVVGESANPTPRDRALKELQEARERCFNYEDHRKHLFFEINTILRNFLRDVYGFTTANESSKKIARQLKDHPFYEELEGLVERINQVIYEGEAPVDVESVMRRFTGLMDTIEETTCQGVEQA
ncbi:MAG: hypothetical protein KAJ09_00525 [Deltaproteobacteria bacterium]|nr:hypothetical protein [Deltaproteobacteria bacterium]